MTLTRHGSDIDRGLLEIDELLRLLLLFLVLNICRWITLVHFVCQRHWVLLRYLIPGC